MKRLVAWELLKLRTVRSIWGLIGAAVALTAVRFAMVVASAGKLEASPLGTAASTRSLMSAVGAGTLLFLVIGNLAVSSEIRHATIGWTFLAVPDRGRVVRAKAATVGLLGLAYVLVAGLIVLAATSVVLAGDGLPLPAAGGEILATTAGVALGLPLYAVLGAGLGAVFRHQVPGLLVPLAWLLLVENLLPSFGLVELYAWLPGGATAALSRADLPGVLPMWGGGLLLTAYAAAAVAAGSVALRRRDVT